MRNRTRPGIVRVWIGMDARPAVIPEHLRDVKGIGWPGGLVNAYAPGCLPQKRDRRDAGVSPQY